MVSRIGEYELTLKFDVMNLMLKTMWRETEELMLLFRSALFVNGRVVRW